MNKYQEMTTSELFNEQNEVREKIRAAKQHAQDAFVSQGLRKRDELHAAKMQYNDVVYGINQKYLIEQQNSQRALYEEKGALLAVLGEIEAELASRKTINTDEQ